MPRRWTWKRTETRMGISLPILLVWLLQPAISRSRAALVPLRLDGIANQLGTAIMWLLGTHRWSLRTDVINFDYWP